MQKAWRILSLALFMGIGRLYAQEPGEEYMMEESEDVVLDYRGLIRKIAEMRQHEDEVLRKLEDLSNTYEDRLTQLEDTQEALEKELKELKEWHEKAMDKMKAIAQASESREVKGQITGTPSDRYTAGYPD